MQVLKQAHHRNGITGQPFTVGIVDHTPEEGALERTFLVIQFDDDKSHTAVFDMHLLREGTIEFGKNSWAGDRFAEEFAKVVAD